MMNPPNDCIFTEAEKICQPPKPKTTTTRAPKFTEAEKLALSVALLEKDKIINGQFSPTLTKQTKSKAWSEICEAVNAVSAVPRSLAQIQEKAKNMKKNTKEIASHNAKEIRKTGGGSADLREMDACSQNILMTLPTTAIIGIKGGIDTSAQGDNFMFCLWAVTLNFH